LQIRYFNALQIAVLLGNLLIAWHFPQWTQRKSISR